MYIRKNQHGQAIGELMVGLIGLSCVMIGILMIAMLGMTGIRNTIKARQSADEYSISGNLSGSPRHITDWDDPDGLPFTNDDTPQTRTFPNAVTFTTQLTDNTGQFKSAYLAKTQYAEHALESKFIESNLFLSAAQLTVAERTVSDPLSNYLHFDAKRILEAFGLPSVFTLRDSVCMPLNPMK